MKAANKLREYRWLDRRGSGQQRSTGVALVQEAALIRRKGAALPVLRSQGTMNGVHFFTFLGLSAVATSCGQFRQDALTPEGLAPAIASPVLVPLEAVFGPKMEEIAGEAERKRRAREKAREEARDGKLLPLVGTTVEVEKAYVRLPDPLHKQPWIGGDIHDERVDVWIYNADLTRYGDLYKKLDRRRRPIKVTGTLRSEIRRFEERRWRRYSFDHREILPQLLRAAQD